LAVQIPGEWCRGMRIREQEMDPQSAQMPYMRNVTIILYDAAVNAVTEQGLRPIADALYRLIACSDISNDWTTASITQCPYSRLEPGIWNDSEKLSILQYTNKRRWAVAMNDTLTKQVTLCHMISKLAIWLSCKNQDRAVTQHQTECQVARTVLIYRYPL
jgi:hypothetical protein